MEEGQIRRWATVVENVRSLGHELPSTVREWIGADTRVAPRRRDHRLRAAQRRLLALEPHAAGRGRQHQHARPLPPRRGDHRRRARGLPDRARRSPTRWCPGRSSTWSPRSSSRRSRGPARRWCRRSSGPEIEAATSERGEHLVVYSSGDPELMDALRASGDPLPCLRDARRAGGRRGRRQPRVSARARATGSSRTCGRRGGWSPAAASRCSARPSTSASRCWRSRCGGSSSR